MPERLRVFAGDCRVTERGDRSRTHRGRVVVLIKPDDTTLVHDADGYQPVAWLTRPDSVVVEGDGDGFSITARDGTRRLRVVAEEATASRALPVTEAGFPVGTCPEDGGVLVRSRGDVVCLDCETRWGLPAGASVTDGVCEDCELPKIRIERGEPFHLCLDPACDPMEAAVSDRFDRVWGCPDCEGDLTVQSAPVASTSPARTARAVRPPFRSLPASSSTSATAGSPSSRRPPAAAVWTGAVSTRATRRASRNGEKNRPRRIDRSEAAYSASCSRPGAISRLRYSASAPFASAGWSSPDSSSASKAS